MAGNNGKDPLRFHGLSRGKRWWVPGRGKGKCFFLKGVSFKGISFHFHGKSLFLWKRLISTAEVYFYGGGTFLRRRCISTKKVYFYERGQFKSNRLITCLEKRNQCTAQMNFYVFLKCETVAPVGHHINLIIQLKALHCGICDLSSLWYLRVYVTSNSAVRVTKYSPTTIWDSNYYY